MPIPSPDRLAACRVIGLLICLIVCCPALAAEGFSAEVIATRDTGQKEYLVNRASKDGIGAKDLSKLIARERHGPAVAAAAGLYFEKGTIDRATPEILRGLAKRPDIAAQALAYAALCPQAPQLIVGFAGSASKADQRIAARLLAATAVMRDDEDRQGMRGAQEAAASNNNRKLDVDYREQVELLLASTGDAVALEYLLLAIGIDRVPVGKDALAPHAASKTQAVAMAAQFALAGAGHPVDEEALLKAIARPGKRAKPRPALSHDPRQTPRIYAIMAAGQAGLGAAVEPLMTLVNDKDLHTAVYAARALGRIGGAGLAVRLVGMMDNNTPWPVRVALYDAAGHNPDAAAVGPLQQRYRDETGRLRQDALYALLSIAAGKPQGLDYVAFQEWWAINAQGFAADAQATRDWRAAVGVGEVEVQAVAGFYDSAVISDRPVFTVDASISMKGAQIESLKQTLTDVVSDFPARVKFNIVDFGGHVRTLAPGGLVPAKRRGQAMQRFVYDLELTLGTRSLDAIETGMAIPEMDTIHFLSDGAPVGSRQNGWRRISYATRLYCQTAPVAVHAIYFPEPGKGQKAQGGPMKRYAEAHAGKFAVVEAGGGG